MLLSPGKDLIHSQMNLLDNMVCVCCVCLNQGTLMFVPHITLSGWQGVRIVLYVALTASIDST